MCSAERDSSSTSSRGNAKGSPTKGSTLNKLVLRYMIRVDLLDTVVDSSSIIDILHLCFVSVSHKVSFIS